MKKKKKSTKALKPFGSNDLPDAPPMPPNVPLPGQWADYYYRGYRHRHIFVRMRLTLLMDVPGLAVPKWEFIFLDENCKELTRSEQVTRIIPEKKLIK